MSYQRLYLSRAELHRQTPRAVTWPAVSIGALCVLAVAAPPGFITAINLYLLLLVGVVWVGSRTPIEKPLVTSVLPFAAAIVVGLVFGAGSDRYLYLKDAWYYANPALIIALGYVLGRALADTRRGLRAFVIGGALVATVHMIPFALHPELLMRPATSIRGAAGTGFYATALTLMVLFGWRGQWRAGLGLHPVIGSVCGVLCAASVVFSFSRTIMLVAALGGLAMAGFFARRELRRIAVFMAICAAFLAVLQASVDTESVQARRSFVGKLARSFEEISVQDYSTAVDVNANWRGFETERALEHWRSGTPVQWVFGHGFGDQVDLGQFQNLTNLPSGAVRFIPIFHNGYIYLLVKTGVVGVALYLFAVGWLYVLGRRAAPESKLEGRALQGCAVILFVTTWVVSGAFNKFDMFSFLLLIGFLLATLTRSRV